MVNAGGGGRERGRKLGRAEKGGKGGGKKRGRVEEGGKGGGKKRGRVEEEFTSDKNIQRKLQVLLCPQNEDVVSSIFK